MKCALTGREFAAVVELKTMRGHKGLSAHPWWWEDAQRDTSLLALQMEEGNTSHWMWVASRHGEHQRNQFPDGKEHSTASTPCPLPSQPVTPVFGFVWMAIGNVPHRLLCWMLGEFLETLGSEALLYELDDWGKVLGGCTVCFPQSCDKNTWWK